MPDPGRSPTHRRLVVSDDVTSWRFAPGRLVMTGHDVTCRRTRLTVRPDRVDIASSAPVDSASDQGAAGETYRGTVFAALGAPPAIGDLVSAPPTNSTADSIGTADSVGAADSIGTADSVGAAASASGFIGTLRLARRTARLSDRDARQAAIYTTTTVTWSLDTLPVLRPYPGSWTTDEAGGRELLASIVRLGPAESATMPRRVVFAGHALDHLLRRLAASIEGGRTSTASGRLVDDPGGFGHPGRRPWDDLGFRTYRWLVGPLETPVRPGAIEVRDGRIGSASRALRLDTSDPAAEPPQDAVMFCDTQPAVDDAGDGLVVLRGRPVLAESGVPRREMDDDWYLCGDLDRLEVRACRLGPPGWGAIAAATVEGWRWLGP